MCQKSGDDICVEVSVRDSVAAPSSDGGYEFGNDHCVDDFDCDTASSEEGELSDHRSEIDEDVSETDEDTLPLVLAKRRESKRNADVAGPGVQRTRQDFKQWLAG
ncbi:hypothetical protein MTO96_028882 [Rhipicephalus appendiculatus]